MNPAPRPVIRLFGPVRVEWPDRPPLAPISRKARAILGYLILSPREVGRQRLCDLFFERVNDPRAGLRWCLSRIRRLVERDGRTRIVGRGETLAFQAESAIVDVDQVRKLVDKEAGAGDSARIAQALDLMGGAILEDAELPSCPEYAAWLAARREEMLDLAKRLAWSVADQTVEPAAKVTWLRRLLALDPLDETAATALAGGLLALGRRDEAHEVVAATERSLVASGLPVDAALRSSLRTSGLHSASRPGTETLPIEPRDPRRIVVSVEAFQSYSPETVRQDLLDGLAEATVHMLTRFKDFRVAERREGQAARHAEGVNPTHVLSGHVWAAGHGARVRYRIVAAADAAMLHSADLDLTDTSANSLLEVAPSAIAVDVAHRLTSLARHLAVETPASERSAVDHYLAGLHSGLAAVPADYPLALDAFETALSLDPDQPRALGASAWVRAALGLAQDPVVRAEALSRVHRAIALGGEAADAEALAIGAWAAVHVARDFDVAMRAADLAIRTNPLSSGAWSTHGWVRAMAGEYETPMRSLDRAEELASSGAGLENIHGGRAFCCWLAGRYGEALTWAQRCLELLPGHIGGHSVAVAASLAIGDQDQARRAAKAMLRVFPLGPDTPALHSIPIRDSERRHALIEDVRRGCALVA